MQTISFSKLLDVFFPPVCIGCGEKGSFTCHDCLSQRDPAQTLPDSWMGACFSYHDRIIKKAIWDIKYHGAFAVAIAFGPYLAKCTRQVFSKNHFPDTDFHDIESTSSVALAHTINAITGSNLPHASIPTDIAIVPIPPSQTGRKKRGYNQTIMIAEALRMSYDGNIPILKYALSKTRPTEKQATIHDRSLRLANMSGAFFANAHVVRGRYIILVDDITTTGATFRDARRALLQAGAMGVVAIAIAH